MSCEIFIYKKLQELFLVCCSQLGDESVPKKIDKKYPRAPYMNNFTFCVSYSQTPHQV